MRLPDTVIMNEDESIVLEVVALQCCFVSVAPLALTSFPKQTNTHTNKANQRDTIVWKKLRYGTALTVEIGEFFLAFTTTEKGENERFLVLVPSATFASCFQEINKMSVAIVFHGYQDQKDTFLSENYNTMMIWFLSIFGILYLVTCSRVRINNV